MMFIFVLVVQPYQTCCIFITKHCKDDQRDILSQEISILHCINSKDKISIPSYLKYRDQGYMYSPDPILLPFLRELDTAVEQTVNLDALH